MEIKEWLEYERKSLEANAYSPKPEPWEEGYYAAIINALNHLGGMTPNTPELPSGYLPGEIKNQTLTPDTLRGLATALEGEGITGLNIALALDLLTGN